MEKTQFQMPEIDNNRVWLDDFGLGEPLDPVIVIYGHWAVTTYGIEHISGTYAFEAERVWEDDWVFHMSGKNWVNISDFRKALFHARKLFTKYGKLKQRSLYDKAKSLEEYFSQGPTETPKHTIRPDKPVLSLRTRYRIFKRDGYKCQLCGKSARDGVSLEVDHRHPKSEGGTDEPENLWTLCFDCNRGKSNLKL